jgi:SAM-dependent methyltransferase
VSYRIRRAESLDAADASLDVVTAGQCWHWFDRSRAAAEIARVLKPGGRLIIAYFDWLPLRGNMVEATEALVLRHNPAWPHGGSMGVFPDILRDLGEAGYVGIESFSFDHDQPYSHEAWRGRMRASAPIKASLDSEAVARFDAELAAMLRDRFPADPLAVPHRIWVATGVKA